MLAGDLNLVLPEIVLAAGICLVLVMDLFVRSERREITHLGAIGLLAVVAWLTMSSAVPETGQTAFGGSVIIDPLGRLLKLFALAVLATVFVYSRPYLVERGLLRGEFYVLGLFALLGIQVIISGNSLLVLYLGLELLSLALYALVAYSRDSAVAAESAMKYFVLGAIASGSLLYGMSLIYGLTGSLLLPEIRTALMSADPAPVGAIVGLAFVVIGVAFKFGAVPFHMWVPDVYEGAPTPVTLLVGSAPKFAALALSIRLLVEALAGLAELWEPLLAALAMLSLLIGNVVAIAQTNIKRMLAYSTISHVGFMLLGILSGSGRGVEAALFYAIVYVIMVAAAFGTVILLSVGGAEADRLDDFRGLSRRSPWFAFVMLVVMVSMIGVPPFAGFFAKWWVLMALVDAGRTWLAGVAVLFSVIGAFYYLRVIRLMYFDSAPGGGGVTAPLDLRVVLSINGLLVLGIGLFPGRLLEACARVLGGP